jgi:hypothetical protein
MQRSHAKKLAEWRKRLVAFNTVTVAKREELYSCLADLEGWSADDLLSRESAPAGTRTASQIIDKHIPKDAGINKSNIYRLRKHLDEKLATRYHEEREKILDQNIARSNIAASPSDNIQNNCNSTVDGGVQTRAQLRRAARRRSALIRKVVLPPSTRTRLRKEALKQVVENTRLDGKKGRAKRVDENDMEAAARAISVKNSLKPTHGDIVTTIGDVQDVFASLDKPVSQSHAYRLVHQMPVQLTVTVPMSVARQQATTSASIAHFYREWDTAFLALLGKLRSGEIREIFLVSCDETAASINKDQKIGRTHTVVTLYDLFRPFTTEIAASCHVTLFHSQGVTVTSSDGLFVLAPFCIPPLFITPNRAEVDPLIMEALAKADGAVMRSDNGSMRAELYKSAMEHVIEHLPEEANEKHLLVVLQDGVAVHNSDDAFKLVIEEKKGQMWSGPPNTTHFSQQNDQQHCFGILKPAYYSMVKEHMRMYGTISQLDQFLCMIEASKAIKGEKILKSIRDAGLFAYRRIGHSSKFMYTYDGLETIRQEIIQKWSTSSTSDGGEDSPVGVLQHYAHLASTEVADMAIKAIDKIVTAASEKNAQRQRAAVLDEEREKERMALGGAFKFSNVKLDGAAWGREKQRRADAAKKEEEETKQKQEKKEEREKEKQKLEEEKKQRKEEREAKRKSKEKNATANKQAQ